MWQTHYTRSEKTGQQQINTPGAWLAFWRCGIIGQPSGGIHEFAWRQQSVRKNGGIPWQNQVEAESTAIGGRRYLLSSAS
ncbi:MAG: hypothetical protein KDG58_17270, partial [Anaerolineae bacterium]|nr:hypothetical protein [Anaerolineae bacterium]